MSRRKRQGWLSWLMGEQGTTLELQPLQNRESNEIDNADSELPSSTAEDPHQPFIHSRSSSWRDYFFPSHTPRQIQLFRMENIAIPACYLTVGLVQGLNRPLLNVYPLDLGATEAQQTTLSSIAIIPAAFKIFYGFLSDNVPIKGYRRKPYMILGWTILSLSMMFLYTFSDLTLVTFDVNDNNNEPIIPPNAPSMKRLLLCFFILGLGNWMADVMADSLVAQKAPLEPEAVRGELQSTCYAARFFGLMVAAPCSSAIYSTYGPARVVALLASLPLLLFPLIYYLDEERNYPIQPMAQQCNEIWNTVCRRSVWQPMAFIYVFNVLQVKNAAWRQFLKTVLHFTSTELNDVLIASYVLLYAGTMVYKLCFLHSSWRNVYMVTLFLNGLASALQLLLIRGRTFGLNNFWFALGDDSMAEFLEGVQFLPISIMMVALCPVGSKGASYAMFTTCWNSAMMLAPALSSLLLGIWDTSKEALEAGYLDGLFKLSILTTVIQTLPVFCLGWLPHNRQDLYDLSAKAYSGSVIGGGVFLVVLAASLTWTFAVGVLNIVHPGWSGASR